MCEMPEDTEVCEVGMGGDGRGSVGEGGDGRECVGEGGDGRARRARRA